ncbi:unnamed protein product, partial [Cunninghamella blakesleeana]
YFQNKKKKVMPVVETFYGYVETTRDSLILLEASRQGILPRVRRRLQEQERQLIKSGAVFCLMKTKAVLNVGLMV